MYVFRQGELQKEHSADYSMMGYVRFQIQAGLAQKYFPKLLNVVWGAIHNLGLLPAR